MSLILEFFRKHWPALAAFVVMLAVVGWAYKRGGDVGRQDRTAHYEGILAARDRDAAKQLADALDKAAANARAAMAAERAHLIRQKKTEARFKTITQTVTEYVDKTPALANCGLDADGLRFWNAANSGDDLATPDHP